MAAPHPEDELARLQKLLAKGLPPVVLLTGANDHFRGEAVARLLAVVPAEAELRTIDAVEERAHGGGAADGEDDDDEDDASGAGDEATAACPELLDLRGGGLFAKRQYLCIRRGANWWKNHAVAVAAQVPKFAKGCGLVIEAGKLDKRRKAAATLVKEVADGGAFFEFRDLYDSPFDRTRSPLEGELCKWVVTSAAKLGVPLQADAAWLVVVQVGKSLSELLAELGRLRDRIPAEQRRKPLDPAALRGRLTCSFESNPFEFATAVLAGDRRAAFRSAQAMYDRGVRNRDGKASKDTAGVLPFTTSWLYQSLANTYEGRLMLDSGVPLRDVATRCGVRMYQDQFLAQVQRLDRAKLQRGLLALHHCQRMSRLTGEEHLLLLERFLRMWFDGAPIPLAEELDL